MDTSKTYVRMCENAEEIQALWKPAGGDWYIHDYRGTTRISREFERQIWGDSNKTWQTIEIMCYRPSESKDVVVSTDGEESRCVAVADLVKEHSIWLPRQDRLQEMVRGKNDPYCGAMLTRFMDWYNQTQQALPTMEQLWLAFVMFERYNKIWDGEEWKEIK